MRRSTVEDVARIAGVSTATVSRVFSGSTRVSDELRDKVLSAASRLDYTVNITARALRRERTSTVGMVVPDLSNPFFTLLVEGIERRLQELGLSLHLCSSAGDPDLESERVRSLRSSQVEILLITPAHIERSAPTLRAVAAEIPVIQLDQFADGVDSDWVGVDERLGMQLVLEHIVAEGAATAAYVGGAITNSSARARYDAARTEAARLGLALWNDQRLLGDFSVGWGDQAAGLLAQAELPDAIICAADVIAFGVLQRLDALNIRVPEDVLVTGFDDIALSSHPRLSLTTVRQPVEEIARQAVEILVEIRDGGLVSHLPRRVALAPRLAIRSTSQRRVR